MNNLHELKEVLNLKLATGRVLLVTKGPVPANTHKRLTVARSVPEESELLRFALIIFVRPFSTDDADKLEKLETWFKRTNRRIRVLQLTDAIGDVARVLMECFTGAKQVASPLKPVATTPTERIPIEELLRLNSGQPKPKVAPAPPIVSTPPPVEVQKVELAPPLPKPVKPAPEPEATPAPVTNGWVPPPFDPEELRWRIVRGRVSRIAEEYADPNWKHALTEGKKLAGMVARYGFEANPESYAAALRLIRKQRANPSLRKRLRQGDTVALVLKHLNRERTSDHGEGMRLRKYFKDVYDLEVPAKTMRSIVYEMVKKGLVPKCKGKETITDWICANVSPSYKTMSAEARTLLAKAQMAGKPWKEHHLYNRLRDLARRSRVPRPSGGWGLAGKVVSELQDRIRELEAENARLRSEQPKSSPSS